MPLNEIFRVSGYSARSLRTDLGAALAVAAIALPSQMATAHLAGFPPAIGFIAFAAASAGFALIGANRYIVACADSTIAPIFAGGLAAFAPLGSQNYFALCAVFALLTATILLCCAFFRLGWLADLVSKPVTTGFLAGIACHIAVSQLPSFLGVASGQGHLLRSAVAVAERLPETNRFSLMLGVGVLAVILAAERISPRVPGALLGIAAATFTVYWFDLERSGVAVLGSIPGVFPSPRIPSVSFEDVVKAMPLAFIVVSAIIIQTAASTREFQPPATTAPAIDLDLAGVGAANLVAGYFGAFPVNASPPLTAISAESGACSKFAGLAAAAVILAIGRFGTPLLAHVPVAALAATLLFVAARIVRVPDIAAIFHQAPGEFLLVLATVVAIIALPIGTGVATGIVLSLLHGLWTMTNARLIAFERVPGTSIWWPPEPGRRGETLEDVLVVAFQAPLSFLNAYKFLNDTRRIIKQRHSPPRLIVLEASSLVEIDFTAAEIVLKVIKDCEGEGITFAVARLESVRARESFDRFGLTSALRQDRFFHSVDEAIRTLAPNLKKTNEFREKPV